MVLGSVKKVSKVLQAGGSSYEDVEGIAVSLGVMFALILPICMDVQNRIGEESVHRRTFMTLACKERDFRNFMIATLEDDNTGDIGVYEHEMFEFEKRLPPWGTLDIKAVLQEDSRWQGIDTIHQCEEDPIRRAAIIGALEEFPMTHFEMWVLLHPDLPIRSDVLVKKASWAFNLTLTGLLGSLLLYMSLTLSPSREDESGRVMRSWSRVGMPLLAFNFVWLLGSLVTLLLAQDEYLDASYQYNMRDGSFFSAVNRQLNTFLFTPVTICAIIAAVVAYCMSIWQNKKVLAELEARISETDNDQQ
mmetsp:Transcript_46262/g.107586  ORF Transcript_46262/g.107586 Transcript_46262/m.107586 type:complete len:304 (-) Transcript_46262:225-1136(-)